MCAIISAIIGEVNVVHGERTFFLSKSIKRDVFLYAKCLSSLIVALILLVPTICFIVGIVI
jgi:hypothetical protein